MRRNCVQRGLGPIAKISLRAFLLWVLVSARSLSAQPACGNVQLQLSPDYSFAIGSSSGGSAYTFSVGSQTIAQGSLTQLALFHYDSALASTANVGPLQSQGISLVPGKWGSALAITTGGALSYPAAGNISFSAGTIEVWIMEKTRSERRAWGCHAGDVRWTAHLSLRFR